MPLTIVIIGLSLTSSWGNGHATTYRGLVRELHQEGHQLYFLERDVPWYAAHRDLLHSDHCQIHLYQSIQELHQHYQDLVAKADLVIIGSYVPEGVKVSEWFFSEAQGKVAFYDIDTPVTLAKLERKDNEYLAPHLIPQFHFYLSFTGGPTLQLLEKKYGSPKAVAFYCSVDPSLYYSDDSAIFPWDLGYLGTYSEDRQPPLENLLFATARQRPQGKFIVAGPQYPSQISWPPNVHHIEHLPPSEHRNFYNSQSFTLNITRADMIKAGYSPSVRLFEAAACAVPISLLEVGKVFFEHFE